MEDEDKQSSKRSSFLLVPKHPSGKIFCYNDPLLEFLKFKAQYDLHLLKKNKAGGEVIGSTLSVTGAGE